MSQENDLLEYSVVYTDRALNHMSKRFQKAMCDISEILKTVYAGDAVAIIPGSGTYAMEAVARQLATDKKCLVLRNGWFSYRWSQILSQCRIASEVHVCKARANEKAAHPYFSPTPIAELCKDIRERKPEVVFAPHVETSAGLMLPDGYLQQLGRTVREVGGIFVLDCIASGAMWVDMKEMAVDIIITAPQKGWTGTPCAGIVIMNERAKKAVQATTSTSFACDLKKWLQIMETYESGSHAYHATMPTDGLLTFRNVMKEAQEYGFSYLKEQQVQLGERIREVCAKHWQSIVSAEFASPSVVVCYASSLAEHKGIAFAQKGMQIAGGVPLQCDERDDFQTFRIGLFGLDKLIALEQTVETFAKVVKEIHSSEQ